MLEWISALLNLDREKRNEVWISSLGGRFSIKGTNCGRQSGHNDFEVVALIIIPGYS